MTVAAGRACLERLTGQLLIPVAIVLGRARRRLGWGHCEQLAATAELLLSRAIGEKAIVANALKSVGQDRDASGSVDQATAAASFRRVHSASSARRRSSAYPDPSVAVLSASIDP